MPASASPPPSPPVRTPGQQPSHPASATNRSRTPQNDRFALYSPRNPDRRWIRGKNCDVAILVSGDTDFADALQEVKDCGVSVEVTLFGPRYSSQRLRDVADEVIVIDGSYLAGSWV